MGQSAGGNGDDVVDLGIPGFEQAVEIGSGGFSLVYRAWEPAFERHVAIKVISTRLKASEVDRFAQECAALGRLTDHPNIVTVHTAGRLRTGQPYIVMEFMSGGSLEDRLATQPMEWAAASDIGVKLAGALESAHGAGVLHRDVKPANVMLSRYGDCKLGDFGIARMEGGVETRTGETVASWHYAPPEVFDRTRARPSAASDVYSLAATLFALIDGLPPFGLDQGVEFPALVDNVLHGPVRPVRTVVPEPILRVIMQGLAKDPARRPGGAAAFGRQLQAAQEAVGVRTTPLPLAVDDRTASESLATRYVDLHDLPSTVDDADDARSTSAPSVPAPGSRRGVAVAAASAAVVVVLVLLAVSLIDKEVDGRTAAPATGASTTSGAAVSSTLTTGPGATPAGPSTSAVSSPAGTAQGVRLGQELTPVGTEPCRAPTTGSGAAWQLAPQQLGGRAFDFAYYCNLFAGGVGSLDFVLGGSYKLLTTSIGFADGSSSTRHMVRFEFIGDGRENLHEPTTVKFGDVRPLQVDVTGVTRLKIRITELSPGGGSEGASRPVLAMPTLTR